MPPDEHTACARAAAANRYAEESDDAGTRRAPTNNNYGTSWQHCVAVAPQEKQASSETPGPQISRSGVEGTWVALKDHVGKGTEHYCFGSSVGAFAEALLLLKGWLFRDAGFSRADWKEKRHHDHTALVDKAH